ncbi:hypothetical protein BDQ17DRAFT_1412626 [Cyathus striatus]|nr:hypothetical protein BDQ17DRAFT_1412626 [Cyathus striatus]
MHRAKGICAASLSLAFFASDVLADDHWGMVGGGVVLSGARRVGAVLRLETCYNTALKVLLSFMLTGHAQVVWDCLCTYTVSCITWHVERHALRLLLTDITIQE